MHINSSSMPKVDFTNGDKKVVSVLQSLSFWLAVIACGIALILAVRLPL